MGPGRTSGAWYFHTRALFTDDYAGSESSNSSRRSSRTSQSPAKTVPAKTVSATKVAPSSSTPVIPELQFPLSGEYDFKLACRACFAKIGEGRKGYRYVNTPHVCSKTVLIINKRSPPGLNWIKIRTRPPAKSNHYGTYKICAQYSQDQPCKVREENCTFAHNQAEIKLWSMDKEGIFNIEGFINHCRENKIGKSYFCMLFCMFEDGSFTLMGNFTWLIL